MVAVHFQQRLHVVMRSTRQKDDSWERDLIRQKLKRRLQLGSHTVLVNRKY